jgi:hypothetical protein
MWLKTHNNLYADIELAMDNLQDMPEDCTSIIAGMHTVII